MFDRSLLITMCIIFAYNTKNRTAITFFSKFWLKLTNVKRHCRKVGHLSAT